MRKPEIKVADLIAEALYQPDPPVLLGDVGDDSVFATETHPEGLENAWHDVYSGHADPAVGHIISF